jgi:hypothetical protein
MSIEFGNAIEALLLADAGVVAALPGGIFMDYLDPTHDAAQASCVYRLISSVAPRSMRGQCGHREVVIGLEFIGAGPTEAIAAYNAIESKIMASIDLAITLARKTVNIQEMGQLTTRTEALNDGSGVEILHFETTISGDLIL